MERHNVGVVFSLKAEPAFQLVVEPVGMPDGEWNRRGGYADDVCSNTMWICCTCFSTSYAYVSEVHLHMVGPLRGLSDPAPPNMLSCPDLFRASLFACSIDCWTNAWMAGIRPAMKWWGQRANA